MAIFFVTFAVVFIVGLIVIPVIEAAEATTGAGGGGGEVTPPPTTTPASAAPPPSSTYSKFDFRQPSLSVPNGVVLQTIFGGPNALLAYSVTVQDNGDGNATLDENNQLIQGDNVGGSIAIECNPPSQSLLPVGTHKVYCSARDHTGNYNLEFFMVIVRDVTSPAPTDTIAPSLSKPSDIVLQDRGLSYMPVAEFDVAATDNVDGTATLDRYNQLRQDNIGGSIAIDCSTDSLSRFPAGNNIVTCSAVDAAGNRGTTSFTVTVSTIPEDTIAPVIQEPNFLPSRSPAGATTYTVVATDNVDGTATLGEYDTRATQDNVGGGMYLECYPSSGSVFSAGDNLQCASYDSSGNVVETTFTVPTAGVPPAAALNATISNATTPSPLVNATTPLAVEEEAPPITTITPEEEEEEEAPPPPPPTTTEEEDTTTDEEGGAGDTGGGGDDTEDGGGDEPPATTTEEGGGEEGADEGAE